MTNSPPHAAKFEAHRRAQLHRAATWSFEQKIEWLEEMTNFAARLRPVPTPTPKDASHESQQS